VVPAPVPAEKTVPAKASAKTVNAKAVPATKPPAKPAKAPPKKVSQADKKGPVKKAAPKKKGR
jgi:hypothetical protein